MAFSLKKSVGSKVLKLKPARERKAQKKQPSDENDTVVLGFERLTLAEKKTLPEINYISNLTSCGRYFALSQKGYYAIADCDSNGNLNNRYCVLQVVHFTDGNMRVPLFLCSCDNYSVNKTRLLAVNTYVGQEDLNDFIAREHTHFCIHLQRLNRIDLFKTTVANQVNSDTDDENDDDEDSNEKYVDQLCASPLIVAAYSKTQGYGLLQRDKSGKTRMRCSTCSSNVYACEHIVTYRQWLSSENCTTDLELNLSDEGTNGDQTYASVTYQQIDFPLKQELKETFDEYERHERQFPSKFVPTVTDKYCEHGSKWDTRDPVEMKWIASTSVNIHKSHIAINSDDTETRMTYFVPSTGNCKCKLYYDGQTDLLFNLDNKNLVYYGVLFQYLHTMVETGSPLVSMHRHFAATNKSISNSDVIPLSILRRAWNAFARLLKISLEKSFQCTICGPSPATIVCDATDVGMKKDLLPHLKQKIPVQETPSIQGLPHKFRTYIKSVECRKLLLQLSGEKQQQRRRQIQVKPIKNLPLSPSEQKELLELLRTERKHSLLSIVEDVINLGHVPSHFRVLFSELGRNTPVQGILQTGGDHKILETLSKIAISGKNVKQSVQSDTMYSLLMKLPVIGHFLSGCSDSIPDNVCKLLQELIDIHNRIEEYPIPGTAQYSDIEESPYDMFPSLPLLRGQGRYKSDTQQTKDKDHCRKEYWGHPTLSPGIFTLYCQHGVCYGFSVLSNCESPKHPFEIFRSRFQTAPKVIIYDNACKLHQYCLLREPAFFKNTLFLVDRFHWKGHIACSLGYNLCVYAANLDLKSINSQVNEQGNAGIQKLKGHLSYMTFENFKFHVGLYYCVRNLNVLDGLTV